MIAEVVLNNNSKATDKLYHYAVPQNLAEDVKIGVRVLVPFGFGNKTSEAYVFGITESSEYDKLKEIKSVIDKYSYFNEKTTELIRFMNHRYFCGYISAIRAVVPSGVGMNIKKLVTRCGNLSESAKKYLAHSLSASRIYEFLENGSVYADEISDLAGIKNVNTVLGTMQKRGIVCIEEKLSDGVKDTLITMVSLEISVLEASEIIEAVGKRAPARARCLEILCDERVLPLSLLLEYASTERSVVNALEAKGYVRIYKELSREDLYNADFKKRYEKHVLNVEQQAVSDRVFESIQKNEKQTFLLRGVTGSGKTEVYLDLIEKTTAMKKQAVFLVPEISLTPQMVGQVMARFGEKVAVFHSSLTVKQRFEQWKRIKDGEADIVVGARSAVFAPFDNPGLFIIDEEHENTYKSEMSPKYSTAEIAKFRARQYSAVVLLASATPLVESTYRADIGKYIPLKIEKRAANQKLPETKIVDMRNELKEGNMSIFSSVLAKEMAANLENGKQTILFLNRRGFSSFVSCRSCGYVMECPNCNVSLKYHKAINKMVCHYCDYITDIPNVCPSCASKYIKYFGIGTQRVADEAQKLFPKARIIRMDADTTAKRSGHEKLLNKFKNHEADILVGTQMITKGLDFENVTLVGIVAADMSLNMDDYRAAERTFDLITQVIGRAGRGKYDGRAVIQTYNPENETIISAANQNYDEFYRDEIELRRLLVYPPFCEFLNFVFVSEDKNMALDTAKRFYSELKAREESSAASFYKVGEAPLFKINNKYRYRFLVKCRYSKTMYDCIGALYAEYSAQKGNSQILIDVNPSNMY